MPDKRDRNLRCSHGTHYQTKEKLKCIRIKQKPDVWHKGVWFTLDCKHCKHKDVCIDYRALIGASRSLNRILRGI